MNQEYAVYWETTEKSERIESGVEFFHLSYEPTESELGWQTILRASKEYNLPISHIRIDRIEVA